MKKRLKQLWHTEIPKHYYLLLPIAVIDTIAEKTTSWREGQ